MASGTAVAVLCLAGIGALLWRNGSLAAACGLPPQRHLGSGGSGTVNSTGGGGTVNPTGPHSARQSRADLTARHDEEKSNNLQNEENIRRYANPLKGSAHSLRCSAIELTPAPEIALVSGPQLTAAVNGGPTAAAGGSAHMHRSQPLYPLPLAPGASGPQANGDHPHHHHHHPHHQHPHRPSSAVINGISVSTGSGGPNGGSVDPVEFIDKDPDVKSHRGSQMLLFKAQNPDMHKNTIGSMESPLKDFGKRSINCQTLPTTASGTATTVVTMDPDVLSVHV